MPYKKEYHEIICPRCGTPYKVLTPAFLRKQKDQKYGYLCSSCRAKVLWEEMPEEQKKTMKEKSNIAKKKRYENLSEEKKQTEKENRKAGVKKYWKSLSDKEKNDISDKRSKDRIDFLNSLSEDQTKEIGRRISSSKKMSSLKMSEEELKERKTMKQNERRIFWNSLTDEERNIIINKLRENNRIFIQNMSDEERQRRSMETRNRNIYFWENAPEEIRNERIRKLIKNGNEFKINMTDEERAIIIRKKLMSGHGKNKFHQKFENAFHSSIISQKYSIYPETIMNNNSVMHSWDYGIYNRSTNELVMVVDLDGEFYHGDKEDYNGMQSHEEYDEQRSLSVSDGVKICIILEKQFSKSFELMIKSLIMNYDEFIDQIFNMCRSIPFPYPKYDNVHLLLSWNKLCNMNCNDKYHQDISLNTRLGDRIIQHFHESIYHAHRKDNISPYEAWYNDDLLRKVIGNRIIYQSYLNPNKILQGFNISKVATKVSVFSAGRAKLIINKYLSEYDEIFDPFSGFSGRMLGAVSLGKKYIGQDISEVHVRESNDIISFLSLQNAHVYQQDILTSTGEYDCLFTCPPYGDKEQWIDINLSNRSCDEWIDICLSNFKCNRYVFVVDYTEKYKKYIVDDLLNKSHFSLNKEYIIMIKGEIKNEYVNK